MNILLIFALILAILTLVRGLIIIQPYEKGVVVRLGRYSHLLDSGISVVMPFIDSVIKVDMREKVIEVEPLQVITKDNVGVVVDAVIYFKVVDPVKAEFEVADFNIAATTLAQTNLRNLVGDKSLDETLVARDNINADLRSTLDEATHNWGVKVTRVEVQRIDPPADITEAMSKQMKAEREKRARILTAEGVRQSEILEAEGSAQAKILEADAEGQAIQKVAEAANKYFSDRAESWRKLQVSETVLANNTKYVLPASGNFMNILNLDESAHKATVIPIKR
jgi:regulator of protease activity HflC (stomatin/prohibitin superfamily)